MDSALKRSGRFGNLVYVPPPDSIARAELFKLQLNGKPIKAILITTNFHNLLIIIAQQTLQIYALRQQRYLGKRH